MKKFFIGMVIIIILLFTVILIHNHNQLPTKEDVFKLTDYYDPAVEEVYLVKKINDEWLTIFRNSQLIMIARLEQNWLGYWEIKDDLGNKNSLATSDYPAIEEAEVTWSASTKARKVSYYFGEILNPNIKKIEVEIQKNFFEDALIINIGETRLFFAESEGDILMPVNIRGFSETGNLIYSSIKKY